MRDVQRDQRVTGFVIGSRFLFVLGHDHRAPFGTHHDLVLGFLELEHRDEALALACRKKCRFVGEVREIGTRKSRRAARNRAQIDIGGKRQFLGVDFENLLATLDIGTRYDDLTVETTRTEQRGIEHIGAVGRSNNDDAFVRFEPVHFDKKLVKRLLALVIAIAKARATMATDRVDFVDKDNARRVLLGFGEHVTDAARADTDEHFDKVRSRNCKERHTRFTRNRAGKQRLAGAGATHEQRALGNLAAEARKLGRVFQEVDDFLQFLARFVDARDIVKRDLAFLGRQHLGARLAEAHRTASGILLHLAHHENCKADHQDKRQRLIQQQHPDRGGFLRLSREFHIRLGQAFDQLRIGGFVGAEGFAIRQRSRHDIFGDLDVLDRSLFNLGDKFGIGDAVTGRRACLATIKNRDKHGQGGEDAHPDHQAFNPRIAVRRLVVVHTCLAL